MPIHKNPKAILIDLDDTIILDDALSEGVWRSVCQKYAAAIGTISPEKLYSLIRATTGRFWADSERHRLGRIDLYQTRRELVAAALEENKLGDSKLGYEIADSFTFGKDRLIAPLPGALETLRSLKERQINMALITNGGALVQRSKIERFGLAQYFDYILIEGEFGAGKPDKRVFQSCLEKLDVKASETWMIGDDLNRDIGGAMAVGITGVWVDWRERGLSPDSAVKPDKIVKALGEIIPISNNTNDK